MTSQLTWLAGILAGTRTVGTTPEYSSQTGGVIYPRPGRMIKIQDLLDDNFNVCWSVVLLLAVGPGQSQCGKHLNFPAWPWLTSIKGSGVLRLYCSCLHNGLFVARILVDLLPPAVFSPGLSFSMFSVFLCEHRALVMSGPQTGDWRGVNIVPGQETRPPLGYLHISTVIGSSCQSVGSSV